MGGEYEALFDRLLRHGKTHMANRLESAPGLKHIDLDGTFRDNTAPRYSK